jgi:DMSO/TMAO reductase YedYZ molybdopterin-dependent catalytic subunit
MLITLILCFNALEPANATEYFNYNDENHVNLSEWTLSVDGQVDQTLNLTLYDIMTMPKTEVNADLYCFSELVYGGNWVGVKLGVILDKAEVNEGAKYVQLFASDGYSTLLDLSTAMQQDVIIAYQLNGRTLPEFLRLVLPNHNGEEWIALITQITVIDVPVSFPSQTNSPPTSFREAIKSQVASSSKNNAEQTMNSALKESTLTEIEPATSEPMATEPTEPKAIVEAPYITIEISEILALTIAVIICLASYWAFRTLK